jgi:hypothetical protein
MEGAMAAWPELPDGYSLDNIAEKLKFPANLRKIEVDLETLKGAELEEYNKQDVRVMQEIYYREIERIPDVEQGVGLRTHRQRKFHFIVNQDKLDGLIEYLNKEAVEAEKLAQEHLTQEDSENIFNHADGRLSSVRSLRLRSILKDRFGADWKTTSVKKLSPVLMAANPTAAAIVTQAGRVNRMLSHHRRAKIFGQIDAVDVELGYFRAHTGRFSSPSSGKGLNLHNVPKREKSIAKPIREMFHLPKDICFVRADLSNVEYRVEGKLTHCRTVLEMFTPEDGGNIFNDPYCQAWRSMTGQKITKKDPIRQVAKAAVLGLGFCLSKDTPVVTNHGIKLIQDVTSEDKLWDGRTWVAAGGTLKTGRKKCIRLGNTWLTEDHRVWWNGWHTAGEIASAVATLLRQKAKGSGDGLSLQASTTSDPNDGLTSSVSAEMTRLFAQTDCTEGKVSSAGSVAIQDAGRKAAHQGNTKASSQTVGCAADGSQLTTTSESVAVTRKTLNTKTTGPEESSYDLPQKNGLTTLKPYRDGTTGLCFWTGSTTTDTTKLEICDSLRLPLLLETGELAWEEREVYDIVDVEGEHRFQAGEWLVHNCMGPVGYAKVLLTALADTTSGVTEQVLIKIAAELDWVTPPQTATNRIITALGCSYPIAVAAYHIHKKFNEAHPEFSMTADWLVANVEAVARSADRAKAWDSIEQLQESTKAPPLDMVELFVDSETDFDSPSIRVKCGPWVPTVCWREPKMRHMFSQFDGIAAPRLTIRKANGPAFKAFTRQLAIENVTQAAARNMLCWGVAELERLGFPDVLHVHDEILIIVPRNRDAVLAARDAMVRVFGPQGSSPLGWATLVKPDEISVTESMWEDELDVVQPFVDPKTGETKGGDRWGKIERNEPGCLDNLP